METAVIRLRPHHLLDIIRSHGKGDPPGEHPWGAAVAEVTERIVGDVDQVIVMVSRLDSICQPCAKLIDGICTARLGENLLMREYNDDLDDRLFSRLGFEEGQPISVREFLILVRRDLPGMVALFTRGSADERLEMTQRGIEKLGV